MKDEIKEILNNADSSTKFKMVDEDGTEKEMNIAGLIEQLLNDNRNLLDYITNLEEENESLHTRIKTIKRRRKEQTAKIRKYREEITNKQNNNKDYKSRIDKAVEYIKNDWYELNTRDIEHCINLNKDIRIDLLNILQEKSDE